MVRFIIAAMIWATATNAQAAQVGSAQQGLRLAREICADCHLMVKEAGRSTIPGAPTFVTIAMTSGLHARKGADRCVGSFGGSQFFSTRAILTMCQS
jgi:hypothetical protein